MDWKARRATRRFDGGAWRGFAELGCVYGPEWWKRGSPPVIAAIIFAIARAQRAAVLANQRQIRGPIPGPRGWLRERWHAYRVFAEFARSVTEAMEQWGPQPRPLELQVVRRDEIVGMQIGPWGPMPGSHEVEFCGRPTRFQLGPFAVARVAGAPIVPVFAVRTGIRRYQIRVVGRFAPKTPAESVAALAATVRTYERLVRAVPAQWLMFEDVWGAPTAGRRDAAETGSPCAALRRGYRPLA